MTITPRVRHELSPHAEIHDALPHVVCVDCSGPRPMPTDAQPPVVTPPHSRWSPWEHERFLEALELYPTGPWSHIAWHIGSKTARQVMTHAQKYRQKLQRRQKREEALKRLEEARLAAEETKRLEDARRAAEAREAAALAQALVASVSTTTQGGQTEADAEEDALLSAIVEEVLAQSLAPPAHSPDEQQVNNAPTAASNEPASSHSDAVLEDLLRWTDQFFAGFAPTSTEFEPLQ